MIMSLRNQVTLTKKKKKNPHKGNLRRNHWEIQREDTRQSTRW
jgi:hypothetical protein